ncbi:MAG: SapC family protein [Fibrobacter sp.]|nr:SapC family protein [Fibrobacter sp.]
MNKKVLFYSDIKPLSSVDHSDLFLRDDAGYAFARKVNAVPLTTIEFTKAAAEYAIVFAGEKESMAPYAVLSIYEGDNHFVDEDGKFKASYIPAFIRRYPFVFTTFDEGKNFTLCIDLESPSLNSECIGYRLFEQDGRQSEYLSRIVAFMTEYQRQFNRTSEFCKKLQEFDLLAPFSAQVKTDKKEPHTLTGFYAVGKDRLKGLSDSQLRQLVQSDELGLIYNHIQSMVNFDRFARI